ncbi:methionine-gamma-lyase [Pullulanibacillus pueri]|uniref:L-methionine gamma-lyase n=1 Tax=Pullulanibacillus pueri TaxID=1437324 RepID=A0A8J3ELY1_9BACL|nr:methionine gamma-lyase [Pullulanibacillus pueri]MBM7680773.1 methionine-gamma-lyase [Pullulanibacillus pueri]GGH78275.1 methionine gamma-lyase [Pullulanibacillus pueri]
MKKRKFETEVIHSGYNAWEHQEALAPPLYQTSTFVFQSSEQGEARFSGEDPGYIYSRLGNPTVAFLEERIATLENGERALAFSSGMAAISATLIHLTRTGDHILCSSGVYGCTFGLLHMLEEKYHITHDFHAMQDETSVREAIQPHTSCIYIETPINPTMKLVDLEMVARIANEKQIPVVVDNTFCSPYLQRPLEFGCDYVIHSATKYIGGHGDVVAGLVVGKQKAMSELSRSTQKDIGGVLAPFNAWLLLRGLKTLPLRLDRHCENARKIASHLKQHPFVDTLFYPGDKDFPQYSLAKKQMQQPGGMIAFTIKGGKQEAQKFMNALKLIKIAVSLGDAETLIEHPATMTHALIPRNEQRKMGITDNLLRLSVGLESWEDIWRDLEKAFSIIQNQ